jgi:NAD+ synthase (glutamine-hydrolysing)
MRVALCQINTVVGDLAENADRMLTWYAHAAARGAELVVFPELALTGYPPRDLLDLPDFLRGVERAVAGLAEATGPTGLVFGTPTPNPALEGKPLANAALVCAGGKVIHEVRKKLLPTYDVFDEARYFEPDRDEARPVEFGGVRWGLHVCEDAWNEEGFWPRRLYRRDPVEELARHGAEVLHNISASPFYGRKGPLRRAMFRSHCARHRLPLLYTNLVGGNDELIFDGEAYVFDAGGELTASGRPFEEEILLVEISGDAPRRAKALLSLAPPAGAAAAAAPITAPSGSGRAAPEEPAAVHPELEEPASLYRALVLGLRDYARKCGFMTAVLGLSGGIDSAVTAALGAEALGPRNILGVSLPSRYTSDRSRRDAEAVAKNLGIGFLEMSIERVFAGSLETLAPSFAGTESGLAEENLQARARGLLLMALSNKFGHLVLTTGNKSEIAVGYCTLYGDMAGGLAVISDVPKTLVYELARFMNRERETIPVSTIERAPSAELKPDQTDQDSLPPYELLDRILEGYIEEGLGAGDLVAQGLPEAVVTRIIRMVSRAEYKRRQAAPGLKVSPKAFGSGRRMPIATTWPSGDPEVPRKSKNQPSKTMN